MKRSCILMLIVAAMFVAVLGAGCATYQAGLRTIEAGNAELTGNYTLIRYGGNYSDDFETYAILVPENSKYRVEVFKPVFEYRVTRNLPAKQALEMARTFVKWHPDFSMHQVSGIVGPEGNVIGYEVKAIYRMILFGVDDVVIIDYLPKAGNMIEVHSRLHEVVKQRNKGGAGHDDGGH